MLVEANGQLYCSENSVINSACDDVQELWEVEEDAGVGHDLLVRHKAGEDGERHGLVHPKNIDDLDVVMHYQRCKMLASQPRMKITCLRTKCD